MCWDSYFGISVLPVAAKYIKVQAMDFILQKYDFKKLIGEQQNRIEIKNIILHFTKQASEAEGLMAVWFRSPTVTEPRFESTSFQF